MQRTDVELEAHSECRRQHPCDRGADGDYGQHGHQRVARDEDEYKVGADLCMHDNKVGTYLNAGEQRVAGLRVLAEFNGARMHASHRVHMAYQRDGNVHDRRLLDATAG